MAEIRGLARTEQAPAPRPGDFVATETAAAIMGTLNLIRTLDGGGVTTIAGASGIGKTTTPLDFAAGPGRDAIHLRIAKGEGRPFCIACSIFAARGWGASSGPRAQDDFAAEDWREYLAQVSGAGIWRRYDDKFFPGGGLTKARQSWPAASAPTAFCWSMTRRTCTSVTPRPTSRGPVSSGCGPVGNWAVSPWPCPGPVLALCGNLSLPDIMEKDAPDLLNRTRRPLFLKGAAKADVQALAQCWGVRDPDALKALSEVATRRGGLRNVVNVLNLAMDFGGGTATPASIKVAIEAEGLARKGGV